MPALTPVVDTLDAVPEPVRQYYVQRDGKYHVDLSAPPAGFVPVAQLTEANGKVVEFRDNNIKLTQKVAELEPLKTQFEGIDPVAAKAAIAAQKALGSKGVTDEASLDARIAAAVAPILEQNKAITSALESERKVASEQLFRNHLGEKFNKAGGQPSALNFIVGEALNKFEVKDGKVVAKLNVFSTDKPGNPLEVDEWLTHASKDYDYAFKKSSGSGATGSSGDAPTARTLKPGQTLLRNPTPQQLGEHSKDILAGKIIVQHDDPTPTVK